MSEVKKTDSSIVFKLNAWYITHIVLKLLYFNMIIVLLFIWVLFNNAEKTVINSNPEQGWQSDIFDDSPKGVKIPSFVKRVFPEYMRNNIRQLKASPIQSGFWESVKGITYRVWIPHGNTYTAKDYPIGQDAVLFLRLFVVLLFFELLSVISSIGKGARAVRYALMPIAVLTEKARSINTNQSSGSSAQLKDLTGTIDKINATRLDTRISLGSSQSELKDLAQAINGMLDRINNAYLSQARFVSDASHELRTPIAVIQGYANLLDRWGKNDEKALQESINAIKSEAESMKELVEQLLFLARGDNDSMQLNMEDIDLGLLVSEIMRETQMIDQGHDFSSNTEDNIIITGDIQLIKQAIRILVDNSIKYTPLGEKITVSAYHEGGLAKLTVQDNGIGIPTDDLPYVFERFFRSDDSRARKTGGTGLGLAIAKWIIERHKGSVEILSRKDFGTRITISLECKEQNSVHH